MQSMIDVAQLRLLSGQNARFVKEGDFPVLYLKNGQEETYAGIVVTALAFPFEKTEEFIVVKNENGEDLGMIRHLTDFPEEQRAILRNDLAQRYYMPVIRRILKVTDRNGYSGWEVETDKGRMQISIKDVYRSTLHIGSRMIVTDADGNRYDIPDTGALDRRSRRKIEIYLR